MLRYKFIACRGEIVLAGNSDRETFVITIVCSIFYIKLKVCLFVSLYLIQIYISEPVWTKLCTHLPPWSGRDRKVCMVQKCLTFSTFWPSLSGASAESSARNGCRRESCATALYPRFLLVLVWLHGNYVLADDSFAFLREVSCTMGNA
jgi:hypothetical protein